MSSSDRPDLLLTYDFPPMGGGIARMMAEVAGRYPPPGLVVSTGIPKEARDRAQEERVRVHRVRVPAERLRTLGGLRRWTDEGLSLVKRYRPGFVWAGNIRPAATVAVRLFRTTKVPYGLIAYGGDLVALGRKAESSRWQRWRLRRELGGAAALVAISDWTAERLVELGRAVGLEDLAPRVHVVPLGSDPRTFRPDRAPASLSRRLGLPEGRWLLTVGRLVPHKGVDVALEALLLLSAEVPALRYAVVGGGPERERLEAKARALGIAERVHWLGEVPDDDLPPLYAMAEVYVGLSREEGIGVEGFGIALVDASASGRPVVAGRSGGTAAAVHDGITGLLVDPTSPGAAARAIGTLLAEPERARAMGAAGRHLVERDLNWKRVARDLARISRAAQSA